MLLARLSLGAAVTACAACVATWVTRDHGRAAWCLGAAFLLLSLPSHFHSVWDDYPVWYHAVYLLYLVPIAGYSGSGLAARMHTPSLAAAQRSGRAA